MASVLVADDDAVVRAILCCALQETGCRVEFARDGVEAIEMFMAGSFDLVITDLQMPRMDGCMVAQYIRTTEKKVPVIGMSSDIQGLDGKFDLLLEHPFTLKLFMETVLEALETGPGI